MEYILGESSTNKIERTSPLLISCLAFFRSSTYFIMAGKTLASPDQIKMRLIDCGVMISGSCLSSVSSNTRRITGFLGYCSLMAVPRDIGS